MQSKLCNHDRLAALRHEISKLEGGATLERGAITPSGCGGLDALLPERGFRSGTLIEWLAAEEGAGAVTLAFHTAAQVCQDDGGVVVLDRDRQFYPPAAVRLGIDPARLIVLHAANRADHHWALDQALRCPAVAAVVAWPDFWGKLDGRTFRRLQLAAEQGGGLGLWIRPDTVRAEPSWADVRLLVEPLPSGSRYGEKRRWKVCVLHCRGGSSERAGEVEINEESPSLFV